jgi:tetratricopeptide (TPR) repeat protein
LYNTEEYQQALGCFLAAAEINERSSEIWFNIGVIQEQLELLEDAANSYKKVTFHPLHSHNHLLCAVFAVGTRVHKSLFKSWKNVEREEGL